MSESMSGRLVSIQVGRPRTLQGVKRWRSSFHKLPVTGPVRLGATNLEGDQQADLRVHGGPDQAVLCYAAAHYAFWSQALGFPMPNGGFGENFTIEGLDEWSTCLGDVYEIGEAVVQVTQPRGPCAKIGYRWGIPDLLQKVSDSERSGWYLRVIREGVVEAGQPVVVAERPNPKWSVNRADRAWRRRKAEPAEAAALIECTGLAGDLRALLEEFAARS